MATHKAKEKPVPVPHPRDGIGERLEALLKERDHLGDRLDFHRSTVTDLRAQIGKVNQTIRETVGFDTDVEPQVRQAFVAGNAQSALSQVGQYGQIGQAWAGKKP